MRRSDAMLALVRPRSTWLKKLSLSPARSATSRSVHLLAVRMSRSRSPTSTSFVTDEALEGTQTLPSTQSQETEVTLRLR
jgi:hypothetical protein